MTVSSTATTRGQARTVGATQRGGDEAGGGGQPLGQLGRVGWQRLQRAVVEPLDAARCREHVRLLQQGTMIQRLSGARDGQVVLLRRGVSVLVWCWCARVCVLCGGGSGGGGGGGVGGSARTASSGAQLTTWVICWSRAHESLEASAAEPT